MYFSNDPQNLSTDNTLIQLYAIRNLKSDKLAFLIHEICAIKNLQVAYKKLDQKIILKNNLYNSINNGNFLDYLKSENLELSNKVAIDNFKNKVKNLCLLKNDNPYFLINSNGSITLATNKDADKLIYNLIREVIK